VSLVEAYGIFISVSSKGGLSRTLRVDSRMVSDLHGFAEANDCGRVAVGNGAG
jgi:hypothetical protein